MKKEILNCINNRIQNIRIQERRNQRKKEIIAENQKMIDTFLTGLYMGRIRKFFSGFYPDREFNIKLYVEMTMTYQQYIEQYEKLGKYIKYTSEYDKDLMFVRIIEPSFEEMEFKELIIGYDHSYAELYIKGFVDPRKMSRPYFLRHEQWVNYKYWQIKDLKILSDNLDWIEEQIAKTYKCLPNKPQ